MSRENIVTYAPCFLHAHVVSCSICLVRTVCLVRSILAHTSLLMSGGAIPANNYKSSRYVGLRHPVVALFSSGSNTYAYVDLAHTGSAYTAIEEHRVNAVVLIVLAFVPYFELANFFKRLLGLATFILVFCMSCL